MDIIKDTEKTYGLLWAHTDGSLHPELWHFNAMQKVINEPIVRGKVGIEVGSGCGYDSYCMAKNNPDVQILSIDISDGIFKTKELTAGLKNVRLLKCSALDLPVKDATCDFAYSFGVLHHTPDPKRGLLEIARVLKKRTPVFLYLYEDHSENIPKFIFVKIVSMLRTITTKIPHKALYVLSWLLSPFVYIVFTLPAKAFRKFKLTSSIAGSIPFNFGTGPFSLRGDLYDRFAAPIEYRFSRNGMNQLFTECGFSNIHITRLRDTAGWVAWGYKT